MKNLEDGSKPILQRLLRRESLSLDEADQITLATWATKTAMMLTLALTKPPAEVLRRTLYESKRPPPQTGVWLSTVRPEVFRLGTLPILSQPYGDPPVRIQGFMGRLVFANVGFIVLCNPARATVQLKGDGARDRFHQIWPTRDGRLNWPPLRSVPSAELDKMASLIWRTLSFGQPLPEAPADHVFPGSEADESSI